jgi:hypothetical protein
VSNRRRARPPKPDAAVDAVLAATWCDSCGSTKALRRWRGGMWEITPLHREGCEIRAKRRSPHPISVNAVAQAREDGHQLAYIPFGDDSGGVVVGQGTSQS